MVPHSHDILHSYQRMKPFYALVSCPETWNIGHLMALRGTPTLRLISPFHAVHCKHNQLHKTVTLGGTCEAYLKQHVRLSSNLG
jgi:hypothetical protein